MQIPLRNEIDTSASLGSLLFVALSNGIMALEIDDTAVRGDG